MDNNNVKVLCDTLLEHKNKTVKHIMLCSNPEIKGDGADPLINLLDNNDTIESIGIYGLSINKQTMQELNRRNEELSVSLSFFTLQIFISHSDSFN